MLVWTIWYRQNKARTSPPAMPLDVVPQRAFESLMEFRTAQLRKVSALAIPRIRWTPPPGDFYKINFVATVFQEDNRSGIGVIVRDNNSLVMASLSQNIPLQNSVEELESLVACRAPEFSLELGLDKGILEGDLLTVMAALKDDSTSLASFGLLVRDAQSLAGLFNCICFLHVGRDGNAVAHNLARYARHVTGFSVWMEDVPIHTLVAYQADFPIT